MKNSKLKWFTLIEMLIVIVIIWILAVVLTESYITISKVALKVEQEKNISEESLILTQIFQSIADEATIDYKKYENRLSESNWYTDILYLTWWEWGDTSIYTIWDCLDLDNNFPANEDGTYSDFSEKIHNASDCELILQQWDNKTSLTPNWKVIKSKVKFRIIPYNSDSAYFCINEDDGDGETPECPTSDIPQNNIHQPAFWMFIHLYTPLYQPTWTNKIEQSLQLFFNLNL